MNTQAPRATAPRGHRKVRIGQVVSDKMQKTIVVRVVRKARHPLYERVIQRSNTFKVHDETNSAKVGDWVKFMETRPLSKDKRWRLVEIVHRASEAERAGSEMEQELEAVTERPDHRRSAEAPEPPEGSSAS